MPNEVARVPWSRMKVGDTCRVVRGHAFDPAWIVDPLRRDVQRAVDAANVRNPSKTFVFNPDGDDFIIKQIV